MDHGPSTEWKEDVKTSRIKSKIGIWMFAGYTIVYAVFIILNVTNPKLMGIDAGMLNLAIIYGFGLILLALIMALIYNALCGWVEEKALRQEKLEYKLRMEEEHRLAKEEERRKFLKEDELIRQEQERKAYIDETKTGKEGEQK